MPPLQSVRDESNQSLAEFYRALPEPADNELRWLLAQNVNGDVMAKPYAIRGASVRFDGDTFDFDPDGSRAVILRSDDRGEPRDLVAWGPKSGRLATWRGTGFCIGDVEQVFCPSTYFMGGALRIHRTPLEWLKARRKGIVIVNPELAYGQFHDGMRVVCTDTDLSQQLKKWLSAPARKVEILTSPIVEHQRSKAA